MVEMVVAASLFFGPSVLASKGVGYRGGWYGFAALAFILSMGSCAGACSLALTEPQNEAVQNLARTSLQAFGWLLLAFLGCLLGGLFYRGKT